jgi:sigma-B regulation protein RsbU (phosphoserine phosphatase)
MISNTVAGSLRRQLEDRRDRLGALIETEGPDADLVRLLRQVDSALSRFDTAEYARCLVCQGSVEEADLRHNPLIEYCLCGLSPEQERALQNDLGLARRIQAALLPDPELSAAGWEASYRYEPAGVVSGDYCDLWSPPGQPDTVWFAVGDVAGKGVAASLLMAHLQAAFRSLVGAGLPLAELVSRVNRQLLGTSIPTHYATLVFGRANAGGDVEMVNAGHCPPLVQRRGALERVAATGFPVGLVEERPYEVARFRLEPGDTMLLYTDGLSEARHADGEEFGEPRIERALAGHSSQPRPRLVLDGVRDALREYLAGAPRADDLTLLVMRRAAA